MNALHANESLLFLVLLQLVLIIAAGHAGRRIAGRFGQAQAAGEIIMGVLLGPSLFGWLWPDAFHAAFAPATAAPMYALSQIGLVLLLAAVVVVLSTVGTLTLETLVPTGAMPK